MLLRKSILICVTAVTLCLAGTTLGKAFIQELVDVDENAVGQGILVYDEEAEQTEIQVNCWDVTPNTEYVILLCQWDEDGELIGLSELGNMNTSKNSMGHLHVRVEGDVSNWSVVIGLVDSEGYVTPQFYDKKLQLEAPIMPDPGPIWPGPRE